MSASQNEFLYPHSFETLILDPPQFCQFCVGGKECFYWKAGGPVISCSQTLTVFQSAFFWENEGLDTSKWTCSSEAEFWTVSIRNKTQAFNSLVHSPFRFEDLSH